MLRTALATRLLSQTQTLRLRMVVPWVHRRARRCALAEVRWIRTIRTAATDVVVLVLLRRKMSVLHEQARGTAARRGSRDDRRCTRGM